MREQNTSLFDAIRQVDEQGQEYWSARDLGKLLGYTTSYRNFWKSIEKARVACEGSGQAVSDHFVQVSKMIPVGKGATAPKARAEAHCATTSDLAF